MTLEQAIQDLTSAVKTRIATMDRVFDEVSRAQDSCIKSAERWAEQVNQLSQ